MDRIGTGELETTIKNDYGNIVGLVAQKDGERLYEGYWNGYGPDDAAHLFSVTKSVVSALVGIAIEEGYLPGVQARVLDYFPEYRVEGDRPALRSITLRNLLSMTVPYAYEVEPYELFLTSPDPTAAALDLVGGEPGRFQYSAIGGAQLLAHILSRATGRPLIEYAREKLFGPLGLKVPVSLVLRDQAEYLATMGDRRTRGWAVDGSGVNAAGWGLFLSPAELAAFGQLYLDRGLYAGQRLVPEAWIAEGTREHSRCPERGGLPYGYLWWLIGDGRYAALGDGGNALYLNPKERLVVAVTARFTPDAKDSVELIKRWVEPLALR